MRVGYYVFHVQSISPTSTSNRKGSLSITASSLRSVVLGSQVPQRLIHNEISFKNPAHLESYPQKNSIGDAVAVFNEVVDYHHKQSNINHKSCFAP